MTREMTFLEYASIVRRMLAETGQAGLTPREAVIMRDNAIFSTPADCLKLILDARAARTEDAL